MMVINNTLDFGDIVYLKIDEDQLPGLVTSIQLTPDGGIRYLVSYLEESRWCYYIELTSEPNLIFKLDN